MDEDASTMGEDAAPFSVNLAAIPDDNAATDRANSASSINLAAPTLPSTDDARSNSVGIPPSMDDLDPPPDLTNRSDRSATPAEDAATHPPHRPAASSRLRTRPLLTPAS